MQGVLLKQLTQLKPNPKNARTHDKEQIDAVAKSIKEFGFTNPILLGKDNVIIAGHCRLLAAQQLGLTEAPCIDLSRLSKIQAKAYTLADNRLALSGGWDPNLLSGEVKELIDVGFDINLLGFSVAELDDILNDKTIAEGLTDDDAVPTDVETRCKLGDVWLLGEHRLMCGDSTDPLNVAKLCLDLEPNLMVTDPPYGVNYDASWREGKDESMGKRSVGKVLNDDITDWSGAYSLFTGNVAYIWHASLHTHEVAKNIIDCGFELISNIIWAKQHFVFGRRHYHWQHEPCWYIHRKGFKHNWNGARDQTTIWQIQNNNAFSNSKTKEETTGHSTQKPIDCMLRPIINNSKDGDYIYDPFGGSGTTLIAAEKSKRKCLMMELSPNYCDVIIKRYEDFTGKQATLEVSNVGQ